MTTVSTKSGKIINVVSREEESKTLTLSDREMDARAVEAVKAAINKAKVCKKPIAGYDKENGKDDLIYIAVNTFWEDVTITLPNLHGRGAWHLSVNTYGDGNGQYCYPEGQEARIDGSFVMRPRSVAVFTGRDY